MKYALPPLLLIAALNGCSFNNATNIVSRELPSPDTTKRVVLFSRDAGATTGSNLQMSVLNQGEKLKNEPANALIIDHGSAQVAWKTDGGLLVTLDRGCRVFKRAPLVNGVAIEYRDL